MGRLNISQLAHNFYEGIVQGCQTVQQFASKGAETTKNIIIHSYNRVGAGVSTAIKETPIALKNTALKMNNFAHQVRDTLNDNVDNIIYIGCIGGTAFFAPQLVATSAISSLVVRLEVTRRLRKLAYEYLRDEKNPFLENDRKQKMVSTFDVVLATAGLVDVLVRVAFFITRNPFSNPTFYNILLNAPALAGIAAGNSLAKGILNRMNPEGIEKQPQPNVISETNNSIIE